MASESQPTSESAGLWTGWRFWLPAAALVLLGSVLRVVAAARDDFWMDEAWSWVLAAELTSPWDVFTKPQVDNNHFLNTFFLYLLGQERSALEYRLPALVSGVATVILAGWIASRRGRGAALLALAVFAASYPMIHFSSEARGYAPASFCALWAYAILARLRARFDRSDLLLFWLASILGFLAHLSYLFAFLAFALWAGRFEKGRAGGVRHWLGYFIVPGVFFAVLYLQGVRGQQIAGTEPHQLGKLALETLSVALGGPLRTGSLLLAAGTLSAGLLFAELLCRARQGDDSVWFLACVTLAVPAALVLVTSPEFLAIRHFTIPITFWLFAFASLLDRLLCRPKAPRLAGLVLLGTFLTGNIIHLESFLRLGRGDYRRVVATIIQQSESGPITIGGDHNLRHMIPLFYYWPRPGPAYTFLLPEQWPRRGTEWLLTHHVDPDYTPAERVFDPLGNAYRLVVAPRFAGLSGWTWALYHNERFLVKGP